MDRPIRLFGYPLHFPRPQAAGAQIALSVADLLLVAAVLYACLPHASAVGYPHVLAVYILAFVAGLISHVPGSLGVFDAVVLVGLSLAFLPTKSSLDCSPFGSCTIWCRWLARACCLAPWKHWRPGGGSRRPWRISVFGSARSGRRFLPAVPSWRRHAVVLKCHAGERRPPAAGRDGAAARRDRDIAFDGQHRRHVTAAAAYGLQQRLRWAWAISAVLLCAGAVSLMLKGFAGEEAIVLVLLLFALLPARGSSLVSPSHRLRNTHLAG